MTHHTSTQTSRQPADRRRSLARDDRGVAEVLGAILMFAVLILLLAIVQLSAVPAANQQVEYEHSQRVAGDMQGLQDSLSRTATTGLDTTTSIEAGTGYPPRLFLFNPGPATGTVETGDAGEMTVDNAVARGEAGDYLDGDPLTFENRPIRYRPDYNEYRNAPRLVIENGVLYSAHDTDQQVVQQPGSLVSGRRISLTAVQGRYSRGASAPVSVGTSPISAPARTVTVSDDSGDPITIRLSTGLSVEDWRTILADEFESEGGHVTSVGPGLSPGTVSIVMERGVTYELRTAAVGIGTGFDTARPAQYVVDVEGNGTTVPEGGSQRLVVEVRDAYNNPVSNVSVRNRTDLAAANVRTVGDNVTDADGRVALTYRAPANVNGLVDETVTVSFDGGGTAQKRATFELDVFDTDGSGGGPGAGAGGGAGNPLNPGDTVQLRDASAVGGGNCGSRSNNCDASITLTNTDGSTGFDVEEVRVSVYGAQGDLPPTTAVVSDTRNGAGSTVTLGLDFVNANLDRIAAAGQAGDSQTYWFEFQDFQSSAQDGVRVGDFYVVEFRFQNDAGDEDVVTYVVPPT